MNTLISYLYRDAGNYKQFHDVVVGGELSEAERDQLWRCLDIDNGFIPDYVGLEPLQPRFEGGMTSDDHPWHEITSIESVADPVTLQVSAKDLLQSFIQQANRWDFFNLSAIVEMHRGRK